MCAIIYANQSCSADPFYIVAGYEGRGTLVSAKSAEGRGGICRIDRADRRGGVRVENRIGSKRCK